jgi:hypothetical protein
MGLTYKQKIVRAGLSGLMQSQKADQKLVRLVPQSILHIGDV